MNFYLAVTSSLEHESNVFMIYSCKNETFGLLVVFE